MPSRATGRPAAGTLACLAPLGLALFALPACAGDDPSKPDPDPPLIGFYDLTAVGAQIVPATFVSGESCTFTVTWGELELDVFGSFDLQIGHTEECPDGSRNLTTWTWGRYRAEGDTVVLTIGFPGGPQRELVAVRDSTRVRVLLEGLGPPPLEGEELMFDRRM